MPSFDIRTKHFLNLIFINQYLNLENNRKKATVARRTVKWKFATNIFALATLQAIVQVREIWRERNIE